MYLCYMYLSEAINNFKRVKIIQLFSYFEILLIDPVNTMFKSCYLIC